MPANVRETRLCIGFHKQAALQTALAAADCWSLLKTNPDLFAVNLRSEDDALWIGKDDEFAANNYPTNWEVAGAINGFLSSEWAAMLFAFGLGKVTKEAAGDGFKYTCEPLDPVTEEIEMPSTTIVEAIRQGASDVLDRAMVGCCLEEFGIQINRGAGLQNAQFTSQWRGCGKVVEPSTITVPAVTAAHMLCGGNLGTATVTIIGVDYITTKLFESLNFTWRNNLRDGFYPGSGTVDGAQVQGRMEHGDRQMTLGCVARFQNGSAEWTKLKAQTEGTAIIDITGAAISSGVTHKLTLTAQRVQIKTAEIQNADDIVTVAIELLPMKHSVNGLLKAEVWCEKDEILTAAA